MDYQVESVDKPSSYDELAAKIDQSPEWAVGGLIRLYNLQTYDEQASHGTNHLNDVGFNAFDAEPLSDIAEWYLEKGALSPRQIEFVKRLIKKYINQLLRVGMEPVVVHPYIPKEKKDPSGYTEASMGFNKDGKPLMIKVTFNFPKGSSKFGETLEKVRTLPDRQWMGQDKFWRVGLSIEAASKLLEWGFTFDQPLKDWYAELTKPVAPLDLSGLDSRLFPYQKDGVAFIESRKGRALLGDEMGLGKTAQAITWLLLHPKLRPVVVVCPASLKYNWLRELKMWGLGDEKIQIVSGKKNGFPLIGDVVIINYDILTSWVETIEEYGPKVVILDECHYTKNSSAQRTKVAKQLSKKVPHILCLSGTPIVNRPIEFFNAINMIRPDVFPSYWRFAQEFCGARHNGWGWDFTGATNTDKLHKLLTQTIMIRRRKKDVLKDLPDKIYTVFPFELANRAEYDRAASNIIEWLRKNESEEAAAKASNAEVLVEFEKLKQLAVQGKLESVREWITDFLESGEKLVIFATHTKTLNFLEAAFPGVSVRLDGSTSMKDRQQAVDRFQEDDRVQLFLGQVKAAGVGITLTAASNVAFMELPWTPGEYNQAADRLHRIGQKNVVNVWTLVAQDTVEEDIAKILSDKEMILTAVLDGEKVDEGSLLIQLIRKIKGKSSRG